MPSLPRYLSALQSQKFFLLWQAIPHGTSRALLQGTYLLLSLFFSNKNILRNHSMNSFMQLAEDIEIAVMTEQSNAVEEETRSKANSRL